MTSKGGLTKEQLKAAVCEAIDRNGNRIIELGETILHHPETGFNEQKTAALVADAMRTIGLGPQTGLALTGVKGRLKGKSPGPRLAFIGELDSLRTSDHPLADPHTGAARIGGATRRASRGLSAAGPVCQRPARWSICRSGGFATSPTSSNRRAGEVSGSMGPRRAQIRSIRSPTTRAAP